MDNSTSSLELTYNVIGEVLKPFLSLSDSDKIWSVVTIALFALIFRIIDTPVLYFILKHYRASLPAHRRWRLRNEITSLLHATISGTWALSVFIAFPESWNNMIDWYHPVAYYLVLFSSGYLLNDAVDLVINERSSRVLELLFHHISVLVALMCCVFTNKFAALCACGLLMEVNSSFLHTRSLLNLHKYVKSSYLYRAVSVTNVATFIVFRLSTNVFMLVWNCLHYEQMPSVYFCICFFVMFSMLIVNSILFYRVLLADAYITAPGQGSFGCMLTPWQWVPVRRQDVRLAEMDGLDNVADEDEKSVHSAHLVAPDYEIYVPDAGSDVIP